LQWLISELMTLAAPAYVFLQLLMALRYRRRWLVLSLVPLIVMVPLAVYGGLAFAADSPLWVVPFVLASPFAFLYLLCLAVAKAMLT
jgi:hypothetical protein